jgi:teichoic acid transport system ATP-binding protein
MGSGRTLRIENQVLHDVSFDAFAGELIGVIGTNGSGKSTLLKAIGGFVPLRSGTLHVSSQPRLLAVGAAMKPSLSGWENIMLGCLALGFGHEEISGLVDEVAEFCELGSKLDLPMGNLSSGEKSRLQFGVATIRPPEILMIDEALSVGDTGFKAKSLHRLGEVLDRSGTVFFVSHNLNEITNLCNRAMWLHDGRLVANGHSQWVVDRYVEFVDRDVDDRTAADQVRRYRSWREENRPTGI